MKLSNTTNPMTQIFEPRPSARKITTSKSKYFKMSLRTKQQPSQNGWRETKAATNWQEKTFKKNTLLATRSWKNYQFERIVRLSNRCFQVQRYMSILVILVTPPQSNIDPTTVTGVPISKTKVFCRFASKSSKHHKNQQTLPSRYPATKSFPRPVRRKISKDSKASTSSKATTKKASRGTKHRLWLQNRL